jgi:carotenoid 1,2-hydratase
LSDCGRYGLCIIAFAGSVFSPYYHWAGRRDPDNHVCINIALYGPDGNRWSMTERGRKSLHRSGSSFLAGPSALNWDGDCLVIDFDEVSVPRPPGQWLPKRITGTVRLTPRFLTDRIFGIDEQGNHRWWPIAPLAGIEVALDGSRTRWTGHGYLDSNWGLEPLETAFTRWDWARGALPDGGTAILYDTDRRDGSTSCLAVAFDGQGRFSEFERPSSTLMKRGLWGVQRRAHHDAGHVPRVVSTLEDGPFYMRSIIRTRLMGQDIDLVHETLAGDRFASPLVKLMLPFRMPRRR